jgi:hypothetical protein
VFTPQYLRRLGVPTKKHQGRPHLQYAAELLIEAAERAGSIDDAAAQLSRALTAEGLLAQYDALKAQCKACKT